MLKQQKSLSKDDLERLKGDLFDDVIMLGIKHDKITLVSSCECPEQTTAILEHATDESIKKLMPHMYGNEYVH